jgi:hypothetical protein
MQARGFTIDGQNCGVARAPSQKRFLAQNVFLITLDALRADHVHCYGYGPSKTPALDKLAKEGLRFAQATRHAERRLKIYRTTVGARSTRDQLEISS